MSMLAGFKVLDTLSSDTLDSVSGKIIYFASGKFGTSIKDLHVNFRRRTMSSSRFHLLPLLY